ncbi:MAG: chloride channel protein [Planctomycetes bacterium]|nr:chloride channel protein [Planctomycetota bacterium]
MPRSKGTPLRAFAIFLLAGVIGVGGGLLGSGFQHGLTWIQHLLTDIEPGKEHLSEAVRRSLAWWQILLMPAVGGLVAGAIILILRGKKAPFGISDLVVLVQLRKGVLRFRESLVQILASACTIGTGGSIGKEGANSHIAATVASLLGRAAKLNSRTRSVLIGCGIAAGMATSYNAPIASAIFVMEIVLGNFAMDVCAPIVVAAVLATMIRGEWLGTGAIYGRCLEGVHTLPWHLALLALVLGVFCGLGGLIFRRSVSFARGLFQRLRLTPPLALALGGLAVGAIGIFMPETWGNGFEVIEKIAPEPDESGARILPGASLLLTLFVWKLVATCATVGSGGLGGIFTPNLVIGAAFGSFFAYGISALGIGTDLGTMKGAEQLAVFAFVGMAGLTASTMHAPVTAVVLVFELTGHYEIVLPVMLCSIVASITATLLDPDSYYTAAIRARGEEVPSGIEDLAIRSTFVRDLMRRDCLTIGDKASFDEVMLMLGTHRGDTIYVHGEDAALIGRIELQDVKNFINDPTLSSVVIAADLTRPVVTVHTEDSIAEVMPRFDDPELRELAVVSSGQPHRLLGRVRHLDVIASIGSEVLGPQRRNTRIPVVGRDGRDLQLPPGHRLATVPVPDAWVGHAVDALPAEGRSEIVVVLELRRQNGSEQAHAATPGLVLEEGSQIVVIGSAEAIRKLRDKARSEPS